MLTMLKQRKAMFFSLTALLLILFLFILFKNRAEISKLDEEFHVNRAQVIVMDHFVRDFDRYYIPQILETSSKQALVKLTNGPRFTKDQLVDVMKDGVQGTTVILEPSSTTASLLDQALETLTFELDNAESTYRIENIRQLTYNEIQIDFRVDYKFKISKTQWEKSGKIVTVTLSVYSMWHPRYSRYIDDSWVINDTGCYITNIMLDASACSGLNIMPP